MKIVVFFSGTGTNLRSFLEQEDDLSYEVVSTFTNNPKAKTQHIIPVELSKKNYSKVALPTTITLFLCNYAT